LLALGLAAALVACGRSAATRRDAGNGAFADGPAPSDGPAPDVLGSAGDTGGGAGSASGTGGGAGGATAAGTGGNVVAGAVPAATGGRVGGASGVGGAYGLGGAPGVGGAFGAGGAAGLGGAYGTGGATGVGGGSNCGLVTRHTTRVPSEVMLVLDRSGSMLNDITRDCVCTRNGSTALCDDLANCKDRWSILAEAVRSTVTGRQDIYWGLKLFSTVGSEACGVSSQIEVPIGPDSAAAIPSVIESTSTTPAGSTPTAQAIRAATEYLKTVADRNPKTIVLATDGEPNCAPGARDSSTTNVTGTIAEIRAAYEAGFPVYVIGIGPSVGNLDEFAKAGGTGRYFSATSPAELLDAFVSISIVANSCVLSFPDVPPDPNNVAVYFDKSLVAKDDVNGWSYTVDMRAILFNGAICDKLKSSMDATVTVLFGCPGIPLPPFLP
jgi:hypothetical protein